MACLFAHALQSLWACIEGAVTTCSTGRWRLLRLLSFHPFFFYIFETFRDRRSRSCFSLISLVGRVMPL